MSKKESNAAPDIARPVPPPAPPVRRVLIRCVTHHHACDCREAEWAQKMATQQARIAELEQQLAELREAVLAYVGPVDDPHIGWRGSSPSHNDLFQCEACGAEDADTRAMQHTDNCTAAALLATIGQKP